MRLDQRIDSSAPLTHLHLCDRRCWFARGPSLLPLLNRPSILSLTLPLVTILPVCCTWGLVAVLIGSQRTPQLTAYLETAAHDGALDDPCIPGAGDCLSACEISALAALQGEEEAQVERHETWLCRARAEHSRALRALDRIQRIRKQAAGSERKSEAIVIDLAW